MNSIPSWMAADIKAVGRKEGRERGAGQNNSGEPVKSEVGDLFALPYLDKPSD